MQKRILLFVFFSILISLHVFAEKINKSEADSIYNVYKSYSFDSLLNIVNESRIQDFDLMESILISADVIADSLNETENQIKALILLGNLYFENAYFESAEDIFKRVLKEFQSDLTNDQLASIKHTLGLNHIKFSNYDKAINLFQEALFYYEKTNNKSEIARALKDIGAVYYYLGNENSALDN
ncbi:MAG: tetratricopeptide repeat protein, partial [Bacteroidales bacterium]|nr:tetratricopeptide repeat protein [Bacteroidales bacterium]